MFINNGAPAIVHKMGKELDKLFQHIMNACLVRHSLKVLLLNLSVLMALHMLFHEQFGLELVQFLSM
jgi:hypothetical protein